MMGPGVLRPLPFPVHRVLTLVVVVLTMQVVMEDMTVVALARKNLRKAMVSSHTSSCCRASVG